MADFQYFNIMDVDPTFKPLDKGKYTLRLNSIKGVPKTPASGKMAGQETLMIKADFSVVNDPTFSGRRLFHTFWIHNPYDQKALRRLADRTGVPQGGGESIVDWFAKLTQIQPEFQAPVDLITEKDYQSGEDVQVNKIDFKSIAVAG